MTCFRPLVLKKDGQRRPSDVVVGTDRVPCGHCVGCRYDRSRDWGTRCHDESLCHSDSVFVTCTYEDKWLPLTLEPAVLSGFLKRLRHSMRFRFFAVGEYGGRFGRPHYHALLFGVSLARDVSAGGSSYENWEVSRAWSRGRVVCDSVTPASCAYVAGYVWKKLGRELPRGAEVCDGETGELVRWQPPFARMSLRPAIGLPYLSRFGSELCSGFRVVDGAKRPLPRYYREWLKANRPADWCRLARERAALFDSPEFWDDGSNDRMSARERFAVLRKAHFSSE